MISRRRNPILTALLISVTVANSGTAVWASTFCSKRFENLFVELDPVIVKYRKSGLKGLDRAAILKVEEFLQRGALSEYGSHAAVKADVESYLEIQCLKYKSNCRELVTWWNKNSSQYVENPKFLAVIGNPDWTLKDLADLATSQFYQQVGRTKSSPWREKFSWLLSPRAIAATAGAIGVSVGVKILGSIYNAATLGTMMKLWNAYTDAAVAPIEAHLKQSGTRDLGPLATDIQEWLIRRNAIRKELEDLQHQIQKAETQVNGGLDHESAKKLWQDFQSYFYGKFMAFNQSLPGNMREGRAFIYSTEFSEPLAIANFISSRNESYRENLRQIRHLEEKVSAGQATDADRADLVELHRYVDVQKKQIAAGLAVYVIRKYMYRDDVYKNVFERDKQVLVQLDQIQHDLVDALGIQYFLKEYFAQLKDVFRQYELIFQAADVQSGVLLKEGAKKAP